MDFRILVSKNAIYGSCPECKKEMSLERVKSSGKLEKFFLSLLRLKKYHCKECKWYGNLFIYTISRNIKKVLLNYLILAFIIVAVSYLIGFVVKTFLIP
jgi:hypothetical protein